MDPCGGHAKTTPDPDAQMMDVDAQSVGIDTYMTNTDAEQDSGRHNPGVMETQETLGVPPERSRHAKGRLLR